ncbi:MAG TPA: response regulator [Terriglobales bacterium]|nr:response regulator [Terriglobales bacterium]
MTILIVDDSRFMRITNERALQKAGFDVIGAADGEEGLRVARERLPDLIVLDMMLPKLSGPEVLKALRADNATSKIPVMVLTSLSQANEEKLKSEGATEYFEKSTLSLDKSPDRLVQAVKRMLPKAMAAAK